MRLSTGDRLLAQLDDLERQAGNLPGALKRESLGQIIRAVLEQVRAAYDLPRLNQRLEAGVRVDFESLEAAVEYLEGAGLGESLELSDEVTLVRGDVLNELRMELGRFREEAPTKSALSISIWLDFRLENHFFSSLLLAADSGADLSGLVASAAEKVASLGEDDLALLWARLQREFDPERHVFMRDLDRILPPQFLQRGSRPELRRRIAEYAVSYKPRMALTMMRAGHPAIPMEGLTLPKLLSLGSESEVARITRNEEALALSIGRISAVASEVSEVTTSEVAEMLGVSSSSRLISGPYAQHAMSSDSAMDAQTASSETLALFELRNALRLIESVVGAEDGIERALVQHKLGLEVMTPEILKEVVRKNELRLQKELCRFLVERGIFTVGTKFGRSETDLYLPDVAVSYVIETKVYKADTAVTPARIHAAFAQLQTYMDQNPAQPFGVLILYNLTDMTIVAPRQWINGLYWILPVNLGEAPPSKLSGSVLIEPSDTDDLLKIGVLKTTPRKKKTNMKKKAASRKKKVTKKKTNGRKTGAPTS